MVVEKRDCAKLTLQEWLGKMGLWKTGSVENGDCGKWVWKAKANQPIVCVWLLCVVIPGKARFKVMFVSHKRYCPTTILPIVGVVVY